MYNSRSQLSALELQRLTFECQNIADWCNANETTKDVGITGMLPVRELGSGCGGTAYALQNWPGLALKVCRNDRDLYPDWIRLSAKRELCKFMPKVFAFGGDELVGTFWCVLPEYKTLEAGYGPAREFLNKHTSARKAISTQEEWSECGYFLDGEKVILFLLTEEERGRAVWRTSEPTGRVFKRNLHAKMPRKARREARKFKQDAGIVALWNAADNFFDMHEGNVMVDPVDEHLVIIDPLYMCQVDKHDLRKNH